MNDFQNGNSSKLPRDVARCIGVICAKRDLCARFMDCEPDDGRGLRPLSFTDFSSQIVDGNCPAIIHYPYN